MSSREEKVERPIAMKFVVRGLLTVGFTTIRNNRHGQFGIGIVAGLGGEKAFGKVSVVKPPFQQLESDLIESDLNQEAEPEFSYVIGMCCYDIFVVLFINICSISVFKGSKLKITKSMDKKSGKESYSFYYDFSDDNITQTLVKKAREFSVMLQEDTRDS